ncbi:fumarylacetoacetate hydrolase family protein [Anaeromyxobacter diazotrophicus]|uniref:2-hydroxyhepta-2,4-diene-1,7-dioate isomerase n=1 Tax=Anaeromyxobacter diazotrophicus TaxID=2590199 RepID=A0A7I9VTA2_9BACT|nr:fumarylacetoacetate hydrolase family protein [Anaeromyxobacter diazotrophicus]GEJ59360.1 2-hydroxyhepta-2,4-diene-1,7-dioate isomerase [Anaeromyxobacter diazotrophicus]
MRTCRFRRGGRERWGVVEGLEVRALTAEPWAGGLAEGPAYALSEVSLLAPAAPSKVVCVGRNYRAHARELGNEVPKEPLLFLKPSTAVIGPGGEIRLPEASKEVHHEAELAAVVGRTLTRASAAEARQAIFGWTCLDDVTARDVQRAEQHFTRAKGYDTFCPVGPVVETDLDPLDAVVTCRVNGEQRQRGSTRDMVVDPYALLAFISQIMTLLPGDLVATGTPEGVGPIRRGDWVEVEVSGIGVLKNPVV